MQLTSITAATIALCFAGCGGDSGGGGGGGGGGTGGSGLTGIEPCVSAQEYINGDPCLSDADVSTENYQLQLDICETIDKQCANCIISKKSKPYCVLTDDCGTTRCGCGALGCGQVRMR